VSNEEITLSKLSQDELSQEELKEMINKALQEGKEEAKLILILGEWSRPGPSFEDYANMKVIYGEVEKILLKHNYDYPTTNEYHYAILPKSKTVVLLFEFGDDYEGEMQEHEELYVFSYPQGWKSISLY